MCCVEVGGGGGGGGGGRRGGLGLVGGGEGAVSLRTELALHLLDMQVSSQGEQGGGCVRPRRGCL